MSPALLLLLLAGDALTGFDPGNADRQRALEADALRIADTRSVGGFARQIAARPHVAGTPAQAETRDFVTAHMRSWGLDTSVAEYEVYLPFPTEVRLELVAPKAITFELPEPALPAVDGASAVPFPAYHGYAAAGDVTAELVYAHFGRPEDFDRLAELGVETRGRVALVRYGRGYRGNKVLEAQRRGALGCIIYSDPEQDGTPRGEVFPAGPWRPPHGMQHGSVKLGPPGDPTTPGWASLPGARRIAPAAAADLTTIPSMPVSAAIAGRLLAAMDGAPAPEGWRGGLDAVYRLGPGPARVRLAVAHDGGYRRIWNTFGRIAGSAFPDEWILVGGHRDAWCAGAADNAAGTAIVMEAARICATLAARGHPPRRTLLFATWDAEEWGIVGSAEWVEHHRDELSEKLVAYVNQDMVVTGPDFAASASPLLRALMLDVAAVVPHPDEPEAVIAAALSGGRDAIATLGGGSDHGPFLFHLGVPAMSHGFGGGQGIYHSLYDTTLWMERFGDPGYRRHKANAQLVALALLRLANADVLPYDLTGFADDLEALLERYELGAAADEAARLAAARRTLAGIRAAADTLMQRSTSALSQDGFDARRLAEVNRRLRTVPRLLTRRAAGDGDPHEFYQHLLFGLSGGGGYRAAELPTLRAAASSDERDDAWRVLNRQLTAVRDELRAAVEVFDE